MFDGHVEEIGGHQSKVDGKENGRKYIAKKMR
jgi:hypothetical protein